MTEARLIDHGPLAGSWNMAVDQSILEHANQLGGFTFRLYRWTPATVSLGYFQSYDSRLSHSSSEHAPLVRRSTGGGAIVHDHELTYSLTVPAQSALAVDHQELYRIVHQALIDSLADWSIRAERCRQTVKRSDEPFLCFLRRAEGDVIIGDHKICGSAQRRIDGCILQHGSILLKRSDAAPELAGINDIENVMLPSAELAEKFTANLAEALNVRFTRQDLTKPEQERATQIERERFLADKWNKRR